MRALLLGITVAWAWPASGQLPVKAPTAHVTDQTGSLTSEQKAALEQALAALEARKGSQLAVLIVATTAPEPLEQYALRVAEQWKLGRAKVDDGALLVVAKDERAVRIEVGYGLEGALSDATCARIINEVIVPRLRQQDFAGGISAGVDRIIRVIEGEPLPPPPGETPVGDIASRLPVIMMVALALGGLLRAALGRLPGAMATGGVVAVAAWWWAGALPLALGAGAIAALVALVGPAGLLRMAGRSHGRGDGLGGGGFGGKGGGFGGGGASGRW